MTRIEWDVASHCRRLDRIEGVGRTYISCKVAGSLAPDRPSLRRPGKGEGMARALRSTGK